MEQHTLVGGVVHVVELGVLKVDVAHQELGAPPVVLSSSTYMG